VPNVTPLRAEDPDGVGRHRLTGRISGMPGSGPFYLATGADGTEVTLRLLRGTWIHDAAARDRFAAEAGSARRVPPFCAARILDAGVEDGYAYLVSEHIAGKSLLEIVSDDGKLRGPELEALALGSATGLASVHQAGLVHGSFGPEYVIMSEDGPRIIEFGITPPYGSATPSADMLAWAQTMVFASMGRPPATLSDLDVLPEALRQAVADCLTGDPAIRPGARSIVLDLLDDTEPPAGALAEGSRRAAEAAHAAYAARADRDAQQARGSRSGPGGRSTRSAGQHYGPDGQRPPRPDRSRAEREHGRGRGQGPGGGPGHDSGPGHDRAPGHDKGPGHDRGHGHGGGRGISSRRASRRWSALAAAAAAVVVIAAVAVVVLHLMQHASSSAGQAPGTASAQGAGQAPPSSSTSPVSSTVSAGPPATPADVPAAFAGSWSGQVRQVDPSDVFDVKLSLPAGSGAGTIRYTSAGFSCTDGLSLESSGSAAITLSQTMLTGEHPCANGVVTLSKSAGGVLSFGFHGKSGPAASGTLHH
jgi:serine/threonine protein kinase